MGKAEAPAVVSVDLPAYGTYSTAAGRNALRFAVNFSEAVTVNDSYYTNDRVHGRSVPSERSAGDAMPTAAGTPGVVGNGSDTPAMLVTLQVPGAVQANYVSGSASTTLVFEYVVAAGDFAPDGITVGSLLVLNGATITDGTGNNAALELNGLGSTRGILVDAAALASSVVTTPAISTWSLALLIALLPLATMFAQFRDALRETRTRPSNG